MKDVSLHATSGGSDLENDASLRLGRPAGCSGTLTDASISSQTWPLAGDHQTRIVLQNCRVCGSLARACVSCLRVLLALGVFVSSSSHPHVCRSRSSDNAYTASVDGCFAPSRFGLVVTER